jgi:hypothetical protein
VGGKKNKGQIKSKGTTRKQDPAPNPPPVPAPPVQRWWNQILDANKIMAGAAVAGAILVGVGIHYSNLQYHQQHRPHVTFSRPIELLEPLTCNPSTGQGTATLRVWLKNTGNENAQAVLPLLYLQVVREDQEPTQIEHFVSETRSICGSKIAQNTPGRPLAARVETMLDLPSTFASTDITGKKRVQAFIVASVIYSEADDTPHQTGELEWLVLPDETNSFVCGQPISGRFGVFPTGGCEN